MCPRIVFIGSALSIVLPHAEHGRPNDPPRSPQLEHVGAGPTGAAAAADRAAGLSIVGNAGNRFHVAV